MRDADYGPYGGPSTPDRGVGHDPDRPGLLSLVLLVAAIVVGAVIAVGLVLWALGLVFSVAGVLVRVALVVAVAALVWRRVTRGRSRRYDY